MSLEIYTRQFERELKNWAASQDGLALSLVEEWERGCRLVMEGEGCFMEELAPLMMEVALSLNPVTEKNESLRRTVRTAALAPHMKEISAITQRYIAEHNEIDLEGFVRFRLSQYVHLIDLALYMAIKKAIF